MAFDKTIQLYIFNGNPNGRIMCELSNWNGRVYKVSRNELDELEKRDDSKHTGVYFLFGKNDNNDTTVYIGEAENIILRLKQHLSNKSFWWNDAIIVISKDNLLNKAHVKYLENVFYSLANDAARATIMNKTVPTKTSISEFDEAMLKEFVENSKLLVNTLGYKVFDLVNDEEGKEGGPIYYIKATRGANGKGILVSDGFAVLKGSIIANSVTPSYPLGSSKRRSILLENGIINSSFEFTKDYVFTSPSLAAEIVMGRSANGLTEWKTEDGKCLKDS